MSYLPNILNNIVTAGAARTALGLATTDSPRFTALGVGIAPTSPIHVLDNSQSGFRLARTTATAADYEFYISNSGQLLLFENIAGAIRWGFNPAGLVTFGALFITSPNACQLGILNSTAENSALTLRAAALQSGQMFQVLNSSGVRMGMRLRKDGILMTGDETTNTIYPCNGTGTCNIEGPSGYWAIRTGVSNDFNLDVYNGGSPMAALKISNAGVVTLGGTLSFPSGSNKRAGSSTLVAGSIVVSNTSVTADTQVVLTRKTSGGTIGTEITYTLIANTSFTISSDNILDTSTFTWQLIENP